MLPLSVCAVHGACRRFAMLVSWVQAVLLLQEVGAEARVSAPDVCGRTVTVVSHEIEKLENVPLASSRAYTPLLRRA